MRDIFKGRPIDPSTQSGRRQAHRRGYWINVSEQCVHNLSSGSSGRSSSRHRRGVAESSSLTSGMEYIKCRPEVERIEPPKWRCLLQMLAPGFLIWRGSAGGFVHNVLSGSSDHLGRAGVEWGERSERRAEPYERLAVIVVLHSPIAIAELSTGYHQTASQVCHDADLLPPLVMPRSSAFASALPLGVLAWSSRITGRARCSKERPQDRHRHWRTEGPRSSTWMERRSKETSGFST